MQAQQLKFALATSSSSSQSGKSPEILLQPVDMHLHDLISLSLPLLVLRQNLSRVDHQAQTKRFRTLTQIVKSLLKTRMRMRRPLDSQLTPHHSVFHMISDSLQISFKYGRTHRLGTILRYRMATQARMLHRLIIRAHLACTRSRHIPKHRN